MTAGPAAAVWNESSAHWGKLERILVATDGSRSSADAVALAVEIAAKHEASLTCLHVVPNVDVTVSFAGGDPGAAFRHEPTTHDHEVLESSAAHAATRGVAASTALVSGPPAEEIVAFAVANDVDLVIIGSRGHGLVASAVLGSVSLQVLKTCRVPVLVVRGHHHHIGHSRGRQEDHTR